ncbi:hypothetical protein [Methylogaea oryzae]|uniref:hypothetical protein n=1 Tax=Methylogaea oryzae TaxID=1295382 RepID=UPI00278C8E7D|nr:hypothetical protein [Methylogaea oryzae]
MNTMTTVFLAALTVALGLQTWLWRRQAAHVKAHRGEVPAAFRDSFPLESHQKAADYTWTRATWARRKEPSAR